MLAALACLAENKELLSNVVPSGQSFQEGYAGIYS